MRSTAACPSNLLDLMSRAKPTPAPDTEPAESPELEAAPEVPTPTPTPPAPEELWAGPGHEPLIP
jgi:hypothetical protein